MAKRIHEDVSDEEFVPQDEGLFQPGENEMRNFPKSAGDSYSRAVSRMRVLGDKAAEDLQRAVTASFKSIVLQLGGDVSSGVDVEEQYAEEFFDFAYDCQTAFLKAFDQATMFPLEDSEYYRSEE